MFLGVKKIHIAFAGNLKIHAVVKKKSAQVYKLFLGVR